VTEGTPAGTPFADDTDVVSRWRAFRDETERGVAVERLADASSLLRLLIPDLATRASDDEDVARVAKSLVVEVVRRYLRNPDGAKQLQQTIGPRSYGLTFDGEKPSGIFFTEDELKVLQPGAAEAGGVIFGTVYTAPAPGWSPHRRRIPGSDWSTGYLGR
jgi:hypothetical protein